MVIIDRNKQIDLVRKRNAHLNKQLENLKFAFAYDQTLNREGYKHAKDLIVQLEELKKEWEEALWEIEKKRDEYGMLVEDLRKIRKRMKHDSKKQHKWIFRRA